MDNLCHTLAGAALAEAGLRTRTTRATATLMIASNLPDIDVAVFATDTLAMSFRRGWTHGVLAMGVLPVALATAMWLWDRWRGAVRRAGAARRRNFSGLLLLSFIGNWLHVLMDFLNSYGVRLLMPFSERWFYGDALYIVDPFLYVALGGAVVAGRWWERGSHPTRRAGANRGRGRRALHGGHGWLESVGATVVRDGLSRAGRPAGTRFMVTPVFAIHSGAK